MSRAFNGDGTSVLVVEDEPLIRIFLADALRDAGLDVMEACSADEAAATLTEYEYSVVLTDVTMPGSMDGIDLAEHICRDYSGTAVIVVSANHLQKSLPEDVLFWRKPYDPHKLAALVKMLSNSRPSRLIAN